MLETFEYFQSQGLASLQYADPYIQSHPLPQNRIMQLRELAVSSGADVVCVEIGGTVGDVENAYYIEAMRELAFEEGPNSVCFVSLTLRACPGRDHRGCNRSNASARDTCRS